MTASGNAARAGCAMLLALAGPLFLAAGLAADGLQRGLEQSAPAGLREDEYDLRADPVAVAEISRSRELLFERRDAVHVPDLRAAVRLSLPEAPLRARRPRRRGGRASRLPRQGQARCWRVTRRARTSPETQFIIKLRPGIKFAPHPAFARNAQGEYAYHNMKREDVADKHKVTDFPADRHARADGRRLCLRRSGGWQRRGSSRRRSRRCPTTSSASKEYGDKDRRRPTRRCARAWRPRIATCRSSTFGKYSFAGAEALDKHTLEIRVIGKYPQFKYWLAMTFFSPIPWEAEKFYAQPGMAEKNLTLNYWPVGTGPYMLTEYIENRRHVLERNPNFHGETYPCEGEPGDKEKGYLVDCGKALPFVDKIVFDMEKEAVPQQAKFLQGYYDSPGHRAARLRHDVSSSKWSDDKKKDKEFSDKGIKLPTTIEANNWYIGFNWLDPVVGKGDNARAGRAQSQAAAGAVDRDRLGGTHRDLRARPGRCRAGPAAAVALRLPGRWAVGLQSRGLPQGSPTASRCAARSTRRRSCWPRRAIRTAATPRPASRWCSTSTTSQSATPGVKALLDWYTKQFAKIGVQLEVRATDYNRFQDKMNKGSVQIFFWGWLADYPDAENFLFLLYGPNSKALTNGNGENNTNYQNPEFDKLFEQMKYPRRRPAEAEAHRPDDRNRAERTPSGASATSRRRPPPIHQWISNGKPTQIIRNHIGYLRLDPELRTRKLAEWNQPVWWPIPLLAIGVARRHRAGVVRLAPPRARNRGAHAGRRRRAHDQLHHPPRRLRRADPDRRQPVHVHAVLHGEHAGRHGADEHRRQARHAGCDRESGRSSAATTSRCSGTRRSRAREKVTNTIFVRALGPALRLRLRRVRQRARHRLRAEAAASGRRLRSPFPRSSSASSS